MYQLSAELIDRVEHMLNERFSDSIRVESAQELQDGIRSRVYRLSLHSQSDNSAKSVIVKQVKSTEREPYIPDDAIIPAWTFFNEWASLEFLAEGAEKIAPSFYGGDRASGLMIVEDLGQGKRLDDYLMASDPVAAESALIDFATMHGKLHASTFGRQDEFKVLREALGPHILADDSHTYEWLVPTLHNAADLLSFPIVQGAEQELMALKAVLLDPGPFFAFIQSDSCLDNCLYQDDTLRLLDFEGGRFDHVLKEGTYGRMHFPTCRYVYRMPNHVPLRMEAAYRTELVKGCPEGKDDRRFFNAVAEMCVYWMLEWFRIDPLPYSMERDRVIVAATSRQRYLLRAEIVAQITEETGHMEAIGATFRVMAKKMCERWPDTEEMPMYPAFAGM